MWGRSESQKRTKVVGSGSCKKNSSTRKEKKKEEKSGRVDESGIINGFHRLVGLALVLWAAKRFFFFLSKFSFSAQQMSPPALLGNLPTLDFSDKTIGRVLWFGDILFDV